jgi:hypothetical protein
MTPKQVMKKCQIGCGGKNALNDAHDLLAECYGTIGMLIDWIEKEGERNDTCTKHITGNICKGCKCKYQMTSNAKLTGCETQD